ncbi:MAG: hypothetical protein M1813_002033 [Trichoglossum hirsutum]|nr:MAG: hypothetical protein M1813_002033 [Trichoglossum hirsutum]
MVVITVCRFDPGRNLTLHQCDLDQIQFNAVSHIWGNVAWCSVPGIGSKILASPQKAKFIMEKLPDLVKDEYFWMDILAVDQSSGESRSAVVEHIPKIYGKAKLTIVIREAGGFRACCADMLARRAPERVASLSVAEALMPEEHATTHHPNGLREHWMERLWPLQELHLSDALLFTVCEPPEDNTNNEPSWPSATDIQSKLLCNEFYRLAETWVSKLVFDERGRRPTKLAPGSQIDSFVNAVLHNKDVTRSRTDVRPSSFYAISQSTWDSRSTTKQRDFVLALFPQFSWYKVPQRNALKSMDFGDVFQDCMNQVQDLGSSPSESQLWDARLFAKQKDDWVNVFIRPKFVEGVLHGFKVDTRSSFKAAKNVPVPNSLGDFCSLMHCYASMDDEFPFIVPLNFTWKMKAIGAEDSINTILRAVNSTAFFSRTCFRPESEQDLTWENRISQLEAILAYHHSGCSMDQHQNLVRLRGNARDPYLPVPFDIWVAIESMHLYGKLKLEKEKTPLHNLLSPKSYFKERWDRIYDQFAQHDSPALRESLLLLVASSRCGLRPETMPWLRNRLRPYLLQLEGFGGKIVFETLVLASKDLSLAELRAIGAYEKKTREPYVTSTSFQDGVSETHVVGLAPAADWQSYDGFRAQSITDIVGFFEAEEWVPIIDTREKPTPNFGPRGCGHCGELGDIELCTDCKSQG